MAQDAEVQSNSSATEATSDTPAEKPAVNGDGGPRVGRGVMAAVAAAAIGTAVAAAARNRASSAKPEGASAATGTPTEGRAARAKGAVRRSEPVVSAAWSAAKGSLEPVARNGSRRAGQLVAERSPDFVRENVIPPFVEGLTEARED